MTMTSAPVIVVPSATAEPGGSRVVRHLTSTTTAPATGRLILRRPMTFPSVACWSKSSKQQLRTSSGAFSSSVPGAVLALARWGAMGQGSKYRYHPFHSLSPFPSVFSTPALFLSLPLLFPLLSSPPMPFPPLRSRPP